MTAFAVINVAVYSLGFWIFAIGAYLEPGAWDLVLISTL
jgi:hypothetical protein